MKVVLPTALGGIVTGVVLAIARIIGETAPLLITTGVVSSVNTNPFDGRMNNLAVFAFSSYKSPGVPPAAVDRPGVDGRARTDPDRDGAQRHRAPHLPPLRHGDPLMAATYRGRRARPSRVTDLNLYYGSFLAVKDVNVTIAAEQGHGADRVLGLRQVDVPALAEPHARADRRARYVEGEVLLDDVDIYAPDADPVAVRRQIGMVFQAPNPFPTMSIYDNVAAGLKLNSRKIKKPDMDDIVERSLRGANLWEEVKDRLGKPGMGLSGGQQQRLCIARATAVEPDVLLMDEPASALDPISTLAIEDLILELKKEYTIVIVTHNMQQASRSSDMTAFFNIEGTGKPGRLVEIDTTEKIFSNPSQKETEDYVSGRFG